MGAPSLMAKTAAAVLFSLISSTASALDLRQAYEAALAHDAQYAAARAAYTAGLQTPVLARSSLLPQVGANAEIARLKTDRLPGVNVDNETYALQLRQPLFRWGAWKTYEQSKLYSALNEVQLEQHRQQLILRVSGAYFEVLSAEDALTVIRAQKTAITEQLESAKRNFEIGTATITDTHEAQARYDLVLAQEIQAVADLEVKRTALQHIVGMPITDTLARLGDTVAIPRPDPAALAEWTDFSQTSNLTVTQAELSTEIANYNIEIARSEHYPTVDLAASISRNKGLVGASVAPDYVDSRSIGIQVQVPIFAGFATQARVKQAVSQSEQTRSELDVARRQAIQSTHQAYQGVTAGLAQIRALEAARRSSQSALEANRTGYEVGVRINIDVLNAQQQLYTTEKELSKARYDTLLAGLNLKAAAGILSDDDVLRLNALLYPGS